MVIKFGKREAQERRGLLESHEAVASQPAAVRENGQLNSFKIHSNV